MVKLTSAAGLSHGPLYASWMLCLLISHDLHCKTINSKAVDIRSSMNFVGATLD